jgi:hypothetical protein
MVLVGHLVWTQSIYPRCHRRKESFALNELGGYSIYMKKSLLLALIFILLGCVGGDDEGQNLGNIFQGTDGLVLTQEEHPDGWGRSECFGCHPINEIHREDRTGAGFPLKDIQKFVEQEGLNSCPICHGDNGVTE